MNKYTIGGVIWLLSLFLSVWVALDHCGAKHDQERLEAVERAIEQQRELDAETLEIELAHAKQNERVRIEYRDRIKEVIRYVENTDRVECFNDDGLQLFNSISAGVGDASGGEM